MFKGKVIVITGGAQGIGRCCAECFTREGATVHVIDKQQGPWFVGDLSDKATLERFAADVIAKSGHVDVLVNNAMPLFKGIDPQYDLSQRLWMEVGEVISATKGWRSRRVKRT